MNLQDCSSCLWNLGHHLGWKFDPLIICIFWFMLFVWIWIFPLDICWVLTKHPICTPFHAKAHGRTLAGQCIYGHNYVIVIQWKFNDPWCSHLKVLCSSFVEYHCGMFHVYWLLIFCCSLFMNMLVHDVFETFQSSHPMVLVNFPIYFHCNLNFNLFWIHLFSTT
jgi:hypothetical protein